MKKNIVVILDENYREENGNEQKRVFNMRYFDEMKYEDISEILGTSVGALKASYHHATKKIEEFLLATD